jgi:hypothetical protein
MATSYFSNLQFGNMLNIDGKFESLALIWDRRQMSAFLCTNWFLGTKHVLGFSQTLAFGVLSVLYKGEIKNQYFSIGDVEHCIIN